MDTELGCYFNAVTSTREYMNVLDLQRLKSCLWKSQCHREFTIRLSLYSALIILKAPLTSDMMMVMKIE